MLQNFSTVPPWHSCHPGFSAIETVPQNFGSEPLTAGDSEMRLGEATPVATGEPQSREMSVGEMIHELRHTPISGAELYVRGFDASGLTQAAEQIAKAQ